MSTKYFKIIVPIKDKTVSIKFCSVNYNMPFILCSIVSRRLRVDLSKDEVRKMPEGWFVNKRVHFFSRL